MPFCISEREVQPMALPALANKLLVIALVCVSLRAHLTARTGWDGAWKLDPDRSQLSGETFTYSKGPNGMWHVRNGGPIDIQFAADGKPYRSFSDDETLTVAQRSATLWILSRQYKGVTWDVTEESVSAHGDTMTDHETVTNPDRSTSHVTTVFKRVGPGSGFEGRWMSIQIIGRYQSGWVFASRFEFVTIGSDTMRWAMPDDQMIIEAKLDGSPVRLGGPTDKDNIFFRVRRITDRELYLAVWRDGKEERDYRMKLASDGRTFTSSSWAPGKSQETRVALYVRQ